MRSPVLILILLEHNTQDVFETGVVGEVSTDGPIPCNQVDFVFSRVIDDCSILLSLLLSPAQAVPLQLTQQGRVLDSNNVALSGTQHTFVFMMTLPVVHALG